jgi:hypothetical protein
LFDSFENHYYSRFPMTAEHNEFPPLTRDTKAVFDAGMLDLDTFAPYWSRRFAAAVIREAMTQASSDRPDSSKWDALGAIADNLHAPPPPPPTREQMEDALRLLTQLANYQSGSEADVWAQTIQRGIAHYCSPTT